MSDTRRGRPRDPSRDTAILNATLDLLGEVGYEQITVRAIAQRAGAGLATLYRRWQTKEELVADAVASIQDLPAEPLPGTDPRETLVDLVNALINVMQGPRRGLIPNLLGQLPRNPALADTMRTRLILPRLTAMTAHLAAIPGVDPDLVKEAAGLLPASVFFHILLVGDRMTRSDAERVVETAVRAARPSSP
jgi:AcrR family transcriptional regulator